MTNVPKWVNSNHPQNKKSPAVCNGMTEHVWRESIALQETADKFMGLSIVLGTVLVGVTMVAVAMWKHGLIIH